jgi:maltooligosyltrehalose trehalohydrolase
MGEEYGETAPFQFFSDHIDPEIADATRRGRREEFATFAGFGEEIPDPQDIATFQRSKLTRERDPSVQHLYAELLRARSALPPGDPDTIAFDEKSLLLRVRRREFELVCNFAREQARLHCDGDKVRIATHENTRMDGGHLVLPGLAGALIV